MIVTVKAKSDTGFWAIGRFWTGAETSVEVTPEELLTLRAKHRFLVVRAEGDPLPEEPVRVETEAGKLREELRVLRVDRENEAARRDFECKKHKLELDEARAACAAKDGELAKVRAELDAAQALLADAAKAKTKKNG